MNILEQLYEAALYRSKNLDEDKFIIRGIWNIDLLFKPNVYDRTFSYELLVIQTLNQGACYCYNGKPKIDHELIGKDARCVKVDNCNIKIALLDSVYSLFESSPTKEFVLDGYSKEKSEQRAEIIVSEILFQLKDITNRKPSVVNIGVVGNIIKKLKSSNIEVYATDLDKNIINKDINGAMVKNGIQNNMEMIQKCDLALVTGMTLSSGAWFAEEYCNSFDIDAVISEPFPFYIFGGKSIIRVFRPQ
ncbi:MAG: hypothetical protein KAX49_08070 [Halanaerobiales bacterium]|nr:hypothetical protein [Halanaerobiales bacterium]